MNPNRETSDIPSHLARLTPSWVTGIMISIDMVDLGVGGGLARRSCILWIMRWGQGEEGKYMLVMWEYHASTSSMPIVQGQDIRQDKGRGGNGRKHDTSGHRENEPQWILHTGWTREHRGSGCPPESRDGWPRSWRWDSLHEFMF